MKKLDLIGSEVYTILKNIPREKYDKIPKDVLNLFEVYKKNPYNIKIDISKNISEQNISQEAKEIIYILCYKYWLSNDDKKEIKDNKI